MLGIKYVGPVFDRSGYSEATRNNILSLHKRGVPLTVVSHCFEGPGPDPCSKEQKEVLSELIDKKIDYDVVISQLTPDMAFGHIEPEKYNIAYFPWETTLVHPKWVECLNAMSEVWCPCQWNVDSYKASGVIPPVYKIPHGISPVALSAPTTDYRKALGISDSTYCFYNICQWNPRKNPDGLLHTYFNAFSGTDDVVLILKSYVRNGAPSEQSFIAEQVARIKKDTGFKTFPRVLLLCSMLSSKDMVSIHNSFDCLVSLHYSEGFGLTLLEAGLAGKPVVATGATGNMEFMSEENSYPVDYRWEFVREMATFNGWYRADGRWASPDSIHAVELLRHVFNNREEALVKGSKLKKAVEDRFNLDAVADLMLKRLSDVEGCIKCQR